MMKSPYECASWPTCLRRVRQGRPWGLEFEVVQKLVVGREWKVGVVKAIESGGLIDRKNRMLLGNDHVGIEGHWNQMLKPGDEIIALNNILRDASSFCAEMEKRESYFHFLVRRTAPVRPPDAVEVAPGTGSASAFQAAAFNPRDGEPAPPRLAAAAAPSDGPPPAKPKVPAPRVKTPPASSPAASPRTPVPKPPSPAAGARPDGSRTFVPNGPTITGPEGPRTSAQEGNRSAVPDETSVPGGRPPSGSSPTPKPAALARPAPPPPLDDPDAPRSAPPQGPSGVVAPKGPPAKCNLPQALNLRSSSHSPAPGSERHLQQSAPQPKRQAPPPPPPARADSNSPRSNLSVPSEASRRSSRRMIPPPPTRPTPGSEPRDMPPAPTPQPRPQEPMSLAEVEAEIARTEARLEELRALRQRLLPLPAPPAEDPDWQEEEAPSSASHSVPAFGPGSTSREPPGRVENQEAPPARGPGDPPIGLGWQEEGERRLSSQPPQPQTVAGVQQDTWITDDTPSNTPRGVVAGPSPAAWVDAPPVYPAQGSAPLAGYAPPGNAPQVSAWDAAPSVQAPQQAWGSTAPGQAAPQVTCGSTAPGQAALQARCGSTAPGQATHGSTAPAPPQEDPWQQKDPWSRALPPTVRASLPTPGPSAPPMEAHSGPSPAATPSVPGAYAAPAPVGVPLADEEWEDFDNRGGEMVVLEDYDPLAEEMSGYMALTRGQRVLLRANTRSPGDGALHPFYVFGTDKATPEAEGLWMPCRFLGLPPP